METETQPTPSNYSFHFNKQCSFIFDTSVPQPIVLNSILQTAQPANKSDPEKLQSAEFPDLNLVKSSFPEINGALASGTVVKHLASSGNSHIYKIWNDDLEMYRAVKVCVDSSMIHNANDRFLTEAKIAAQLRHANIIEVYSVGKWKKVPYIEMEFIDGYSVEQLIKKRCALPIKISCAIALCVCRALLYAHTHDFTIGGKIYRGIIHRDLKPANIMISKKGVVKLLDFGIARPCNESLYQTVASDKIVGTIQYLSPEQMDGSELDFRTDVYSFGAVFYEMLTGQTTFPQKTLTGIVKAKMLNEYKSLSDHDISVPETISKIITSCLQFDKKSRFSAMKDLLSQLEEYYKLNYTSSIEEELKVYASAF